MNIWYPTSGEIGWIDDVDFIHMADLQGVWEQLYAIGEGWA